MKDHPSLAEACVKSENAEIDRSQFYQGRVPPDLLVLSGLDTSDLTLDIFTAGGVVLVSRIRRTDGVEMVFNLVFPGCVTSNH